jgi:hypothetical protein
VAVARERRNKHVTRMKLRRLRLKLRTKLKNWRTEEREIDNGEGDDDVLDGIEDVEEAMKEDLAQVAEHVEPMRQVLYKVRSHHLHSLTHIDHLIALRFPFKYPLSTINPLDLICPYTFRSHSSESSHTASRIRQRVSFGPDGRRSSKKSRPPLLRN